jgi:hypothetical protein
MPEATATPHDERDFQRRAKHLTGSKVAKQIDKLGVTGLSPVAPS